MKALIALAIILGGLMSSPAQAEDPADFKEFRKKTEDYIRQSWLIVVGLEWLKEGENTLGSAPQSDVTLPASAPASLGKIVLKKKTVELTLSEDKGVLIDGKPAQKNKAYTLKPDVSKAPTMITLGTITMYVIERQKGYAFRIKDTESPALKNFTGIPWFEQKKEFIFEGKWKPFAQEKVIRMPDVTGEVNEEKIAGVVEFTAQGQKMELSPIKKENQLFFVFKDLSSGKTTYGPGRFLSAEIEKSGRVVMDFNAATNPPCAFISFATCPLPPMENYLKISIDAGAKTPTKSAH